MDGLTKTRSTCGLSLDENCVWLEEIFDMRGRRAVALHSRVVPCSQNALGMEWAIFTCIFILDWAALRQALSPLYQVLSQQYKALALLFGAVAASCS